VKITASDDGEGLPASASTVAVSNFVAISSAGGSGSSSGGNSGGGSCGIGSGLTGLLAMLLLLMRRHRLR
jgi:hypothetical protein